MNEAFEDIKILGEELKEKIIEWSDKQTLKNKGQEALDIKRAYRNAKDPDEFNFQEQLKEDYQSDIHKKYKKSIEHKINKTFGFNNGV